MTNKTLISVHLLKIYSFTK